MPAKVDGVSELQQYLVGVTRRTGHHAEGISEVVYPLIGAIVRFKDPDVPIKVLKGTGPMGNVLWVHVGGSQYTFTYESASKSILLLRGTTQGEPIAKFTNSSTTADIIAIFKKLSK